ncbi:MAG: bifunctional diaminohydroxyphosphoribosylaminopyrimidine deaminase/5-amino-6-(5-phosphoribosylamino)uracil reductase RibD [Gemmatimonadota bacterium]|nr:bifunctional diaminohydroxyphosphoribosylaminopyrimidine deaminase/5-amino-6-(5-phosphoribosylamino)uracil reductase RibD [Gemmatimonadota bacterium]
MSDPFERRMMVRALELAARGRGFTAPNPMVGAVVIRGRRAVAEGFHKAAGEDHAEVVALKKAGARARGATLVVNLEPCVHYGRTPPCVEAIIRAGIARVVVAMRDPNPLVSGRGIRRLRKAGLDVEVGLMGSKARVLNEVFDCQVRTGQPFVALKLAQSLDGKIAARPGERTQITGSKALRLVHSLRARYSSVLVGVSTAMTDDPLLNVRGIRGAPQPVRVVLDPGLRLALSSRLVATAPIWRTLLIHGRGVGDKDKRDALLEAGVELIALEAGKGSLFPVQSVLEALYQRGVTSVMVEGGARVAAAFLSARLVHRLHLFIAPIVLGRSDALQGIGPLGTEGSDKHQPQPLSLRCLERAFLGPDTYLTGRIVYPEE